MANKKISLNDKNTVVQNLAQGASYREAKEGTDIASTQTVGQIAKLESNTIKQKREIYLKQIESFGAGEIERAKLWAEMTKATKTVKNKDVPDWASRKEALTYIDNLRGLEEIDQPKVESNPFNIFNIDREKMEKMKKSFQEYMLEERE